MSEPENPSTIEDIRKQAKTQGGPRRNFLLAISRKCQVWVLNRSGERVAGMIVERSLTAINSELIRQELISPEYR